MPSLGVENFKLSEHTISEELFKQLCLSSGVRCEPVETGVERTPDFRIWLGDVEVFCEVKQIEPNAEDDADLADDACEETGGRLVQNRISNTLKDCAQQLKAASRAGHPTLLVIYDNTHPTVPGGPFYTMPCDVIQAMFGQDSAKVTFGNAGQSAVKVSKLFLGGNRRFTKDQNTSVSAVATIDRSDSGLALCVYGNPHARVVLRPEILAPFPICIVYPRAVAITE